MPDEAGAIRAILAGRAIVKPEKHLGSAETDWFEVVLAHEMIRSIGDCLLAAEAESLAVDGTATHETSRIERLLDRWARQLHADSDSKRFPTPCGFARLI